MHFSVKNFLDRISLPNYNKSKEVEGITIWIIVVLILVTILFAPLTLSFSITEKQLVLKAKVFGVAVWQLNTADKKASPRKKKDDERQKKPKKKKSPAELLNTLKLVLKIVSEVLRRVHLLPRLRHLIFRLTFGLGDAAATGMAAGGVYGLVYGIQARLHHSKRIKFEDVSVSPDFQNAVFSLEFNGIITTCLAHIMGIAIVALVVMTGQKIKEAL